MRLHHLFLCEDVWVLEVEEKELRVRVHWRILAKPKTTTPTYELLFGNIGCALFAVRHAKVGALRVDAVLADLAPDGRLVLGDPLPTDVAELALQMAVRREAVRYWVLEDS